VERDFAVEPVDPDPDRGDPLPRSFQPPAADVGERCSERRPAEPDDHLAIGRVAELEGSPLGPNAEEDPEREPGSGADPDGELRGGHAGSLAEPRIGRRIARTGHDRGGTSPAVPPARRAGAMVAAEAPCDGR